MRYNPMVDIKPAVEAEILRAMVEGEAYAPNQAILEALAAARAAEVHAKHSENRIKAAIERGAKDSERRIKFSLLQGGNDGTDREIA